MSICAKDEDQEVNKAVNFQTRNRTRLLFKNKRAFYRCIDTLPRGAKWPCEPFEITGDERDENGELHREVLHLWKQNPVECIRELIGNPAFRDKMQQAVLP